MYSLLEIGKNIFESSRFRLSILDLMFNNTIYKKVICFLAKNKINLISEKKNYSVAIEVTNICNARCIFCPNSKMKRTKMNMSDEVFNKIIQRIIDEKINPTSINLSPNGEPLIDKKIFKRIDLLNKNFPQANIFIFSNLSIATKDIQKKLVKSRLDSICVSLNADNSEDYNKIMGLNFEKTISNLESLIMLRNKTKSKLKIFVNLAANPINKTTITKYLKRWKNKVDKVGISWIHNWAGAVDIEGDKNKKIGRFPCRSLFEQINFHANGDIPMCCVDYEGKYIGGNVMESKILEAINAKQIKRVKDWHLNGQIDKIKMCSKCRFSERGLYWLVG